jgi:hypothetical protein
LKNEFHALEKCYGVKKDTKKDNLNRPRSEVK